MSEHGVDDWEERWAGWLTTGDLVARWPCIHEELDGEGRRKLIEFIRQVLVVGRRTLGEAANAVPMHPEAAARWWSRFVELVPLAVAEGMIPPEDVSAVAEAIERMGGRPNGQRAKWPKGQIGLSPPTRSEPSAML